MECINGEGRLKLADGSRWAISAGNVQTSFVVSRLIKIMQLQCIPRTGRRLFVQINEQRTKLRAVDGPFDRTTLSSEHEDPVVCTLNSVDDDNALALQLRQLSLFIALHTQVRGGLLLHGALAEWRGNGVILAGPSRIGKTTASQRLTPPWRSLCDDLTLVVRDMRGAYWAHPWPTWSSFVSGGPGGTWDVQHAVPLRGIFFLKQASEDQVELMGEGQAVCLLVDSAEQANWGILDCMGEDEIRKLRLERFDNICMLVQVVSCHLLRLSLDGDFWQEIENVIESSLSDYK